MNVNEEHPICHYRYPRVSVIIPAYNAERWIGEAIASVRNQAYDDIEMIIVDDGSTDKTFWKASRYIYPNQKIFRMSNNSGACAAIEEGFKEATGKYACVLAADDYYIDTSHIRKQVEVMEGTGADWCYDSITSIDGARVQSKWFLHPVLDNLMLSIPWLCNILIGFRNPVNASSLMIRMESYRNHNLSWRGWGDRSACDGAILAQMFEKKLKGIAIRKCGVYYRIHENQLSQNPEFLKTTKDSLDKHLTIPDNIISGFLKIIIAIICFVCLICLLAIAKIYGLI